MKLIHQNLVRTMMPLGFDVLMSAHKNIHVLNQVYTSLSFAWFLEITFRAENIDKNIQLVSTELIT